MKITKASTWWPDCSVSVISLRASSIKCWTSFTKLDKSGISDEVSCWLLYWLTITETHWSERSFDRIWKRGCNKHDLHEGDMSAIDNIGYYTKKSYVVPDLCFTSFLRNKISRSETRIEATEFSPNISSKPQNTSRFQFSFLFILFECPLAPPSAKINSINLTKVEEGTCHKQKCKKGI